MIPHVPVPPKGDAYSFAPARIIKFLDRDIVPWCIPSPDVGIPMNLVTKRPYRGINLWLLYPLGYERNLFLSIEDIARIGGESVSGSFLQRVRDMV